MKQQAAQSHHYVPKFILRNFLANAEKEQVHVFSKKSGKGFTTSIRNIMSERRFHEFRIDDDYLASFEESICRVEDKLLPAYRAAVEQRRLDGSPEQKASLAVFAAFQMLRTRSQRDQFENIEEQLSKKLGETGNKLEEIEGYEPFTPDSLTHHHMRFIQEACGEFSQSIGDKDFLLMAAPEGRTFYLSDNPVTIHNSRPTDGFWGNMGLQCKGIEVYIPLSANLLLAAWCPTILAGIKERRAEQRRILASAVLSPSLARGRNNGELIDQLSGLKGLGDSAGELIEAFEAGTPVTLSKENMDFQNSLSVGQSREHIVCQKADFELARRFTREFGSEPGRQITVS